MTAREGRDLNLVLLSVAEDPHVGSVGGRLPTAVGVGAPPRFLRIFFRIFFAVASVDESVEVLFVVVVTVAVRVVLTAEVLRRTPGGTACGNDFVGDVEPSGRPTAWEMSDSRIDHVHDVRRVHGGQIGVVAVPDKSPRGNMSVRAIGTRIGLRSTIQSVILQLVFQLYNGHKEARMRRLPVDDRRRSASRLLLDLAVCLSNLIAEVLAIVDELLVDGD